MRRALLMTTAVWLAAGMTGATAQDDAPVVERIVVTAQKREQDLQKVPISVKAIDGEEMEQILVDSLDEISRMVPSLSMTTLQRGGNQVQIRGLGTNVGNVGTVAIYNDGVIASTRIQSSGSFAEQDSAL
jgi:outer membrane receptor protein involved in Fe transport